MQVKVIGRYPKEEKDCIQCGHPMLVSKGSLVEKTLGPETFQVKRDDQVALFHKKCRKFGRRELHKDTKSSRKYAN